MEPLLEFLIFLSSVSVSNMGTLHSTQSAISFNLILVPSYISCKIGKRSNTHAHNLRNSEDLNLPKCRTAAAQRGFFYRAVKAWNGLNNNTRSAQSLRSFKKYAKAELMKK